MAVNALNSFLSRHRRIALDTSVFIYQLEARVPYVNWTGQIFSWLEASQGRGITSTITLTELLVQPYRNSDQQKVDEFYVLLSTYPGLEWVAPSLVIADVAAQLRALHRLQTPDALQAATAVQAGATGMITNDSAFERVQFFETLVLDELR